LSRDDLNLDQKSTRQGGSLNGRSSGRRGTEVLRVDTVYLRVVGHIGHEYRCLDHVAETEPDVIQQRSNVLHHLSSLHANVVFGSTAIGQKDHLA